MKVLKNNYNKVNAHEIYIQPNPYPRKTECEWCGSELEYEESDLRIGWLGCVYLDCPLCGKETMLDDNENCITLTVDNLEFPTHFHHTCVENGAVDCCDNKHIKEYLHKAIKYFRENKDEFSWFTQSGNLRIEVKRWSGDEVYEIFVSNNFHTTEIPFEEVDYE